MLVFMKNCVLRWWRNLREWVDMEMGNVNMMWSKYAGRSEVGLRDKLKLFDADRVCVRTCGVQVSTRR